MRSHSLEQLDSYQAACGGAQKLGDGCDVGAGLPDTSPIVPEWRGQPLGSPDRTGAAAVGASREDDLADKTIPCSMNLRTLVSTALKSVPLA